MLVEGLVVIVLFVLFVLLVLFVNLFSDVDDIVFEVVREWEVYVEEISYCFF